MGRDICYPAGEYNDYQLYTSQGYTHTCYESYRGYEEAHPQFGKRIVVGKNGVIKKSPKHKLLEEEAYAPTNYAKYWDVPLEPGDYIIASLRVEYDRMKTKVELEIRRFEEQEIGTNLNLIFSTTFEIDDFTKKIKLSELEWNTGTEIDEILRKGVKKALKIPKHLTEE